MAGYAKIAPVAAQEGEEGEQLVDSEPLELPPPAASLWSSICCFGEGAFGIKAVILGSVVVQNTAYALVRRYSRGSLRETYSTSSVLLVMEVAKMLLSAVQVGPCRRESGHLGITAPRAHRPPLVPPQPRLSSPTLRRTCRQALPSPSTSTSSGTA